MKKTDSNEWIVSLAMVLRASDSGLFMVCDLLHPNECFIYQALCGKKYLTHVRLA